MFHTMDLTFHYTDKRQIRRLGLHAVDFYVGINSGFLDVWVFDYTTTLSGPVWTPASTQ